jgi:hypothetical protein
VPLGGVSVTVALPLGVVPTWAVTVSITAVYGSVTVAVLAADGSIAIWVP